MPMTKAEADDVSNKLGDLREDFDSLKKLVENSNNSLADISKTLESLNTTLTQKIDDGNAKLSKEIQRIETSFNTELIGLKAADDEIRLTIKELNVNTSKNINDLEKTSKMSKPKLMTNSDNLMRPTPSLNPKPPKSSVWRKNVIAASSTDEAGTSKLMACLLKLVTTPRTYDVLSFRYVKRSTSVYSTSISKQYIDYLPDNHQNQ